MMERELTEYECLQLYEGLRCPFCYQTEGMLRGPRGSIMQNTVCPDCDCKLNVIAFDYWNQGVYPPIGQVLRSPRPGFHVRGEPYVPPPPLPPQRKTLWERVREMIGL